MTGLSKCEGRATHGVFVTKAALDVAPDASYYLSLNNSQGDIRRAVQWMVSEGVDVINMSFTAKWDGPGDGTSPYTDSTLNSVRLAVEGGGVVTMAAGNSRPGTWYGTFADTDGDKVLNFKGDDECNGLRLGAGQQLIAQLRWQDKWKGATRDLDLYLYRDDGSAELERVAKSEGAQAGGAGDDPNEIIRYTSPVTGEYCLAVQHQGGGIPDWVQLQHLAAKNALSCTIRATPLTTLGRAAVQVRSQSARRM